MRNAARTALKPQQQQHQLGHLQRVIPSSATSIPQFHNNNNNNKNVQCRYFSQQSIFNDAAQTSHKNANNKIETTTTTTSTSSDEFAPETIEDQKVNYYHHIITDMIERTNKTDLNNEQRTTTISPKLQNDQ